MSERVNGSHSIKFKELVEATIEFVGINAETMFLMITKKLMRKDACFASGVLHNVTIPVQKTGVEKTLGS